MKTDDTHREQLSALIDGELDAEQARFLLRRLQHDGELAGDLERWQWAADTLRGQPLARASSGFAQRVAAAIAEEAAPPIDEVLPAVAATRPIAASASPRKPVAPQRWRWFTGGALAASLGFAAMLSLRPDAVNGDTVNVASGVDTQPATTAKPLDIAESSASLQAASPAEPAVHIAEAVPESAPRTPATPSAAVRANTARIARAEPRTASDNRTTLTPLHAADAAPIHIADAASATASTDDPFRQPQAKSSWPRALIPGAGSGTFNARLEQSGGYFQTQLPVQSRIGDNP